MAAYAALVSLKNTIDNVLNHTHLSTYLDKNQTESLGKKLEILLDFVESHHFHGGNREAEVLESQIASAAHSAEDVIESHIVDRIEPLLAGSNIDREETSFSLLFCILVNIMQQIKIHHCFLASLDSKRVEALNEKLDIFLDFIENHNSHFSSEEAAEVLESQLASEAQAVKDAFESHEELVESHRSTFDNVRTAFIFMLDWHLFILELILNHPRFWTFVDKEMIESLSYDVESMRSNMTSAYQSAEEVIESDQVDQKTGSTFDHEETSSSSLFDLPNEINAMKKKVLKVHKKLLGKKVVLVGSENSFSPDLQKILEDMDSVKEKVNKVKEVSGFKDLPLTSSMPIASSKNLTTGKTVVVGFENYLFQLLDWFTTPQPDLQIITVTGMGGIGKTTLARKVYEDVLTMQHFDVHVWITVSQEYNVREMFFQTLSRLGKPTKELEDKTEDELGVMLHKILFGRRYLVILDDMWSAETWSEIRFYFPREETKSRIVVTTRQSDVANQFGSLRLGLDFLDTDGSWELFCEKAFEQGCCPSELETIGQRIVKKCKGLPLSIVVIGGLLRKSSRTLEHWEDVEKDLSSILNSTEDNQCFNILSLSYSYMPAHLKPCFLYLGVFPEDHEISVSRLTKLWVAEGFLKPNIEPSLEKVGKVYIKDLVDRNLLSVRTLSLTGKVKTFGIHDLLRDLCIKIAEKEKFFCLIRELDTPPDIGRHRRFVIPESFTKESPLQRYHTWQSPNSLARSVISEFPCHISPKCRLLRVFSDAYVGSLDTAFEQVNLRFLDCNPSGMSDSINSYKLPSSISLLWNLQTLVIKCFHEVVAPSEIWEMQQLRHLQTYKVFLHEPPLSSKKDRIVLRNLQTFGMTSMFKFSEEVCKRIPNIKRLNMFFSDNLWGPADTLSYFCFYNIGRLTKLESLHFSSREVPMCFSQNIRKFPSSLKKLSLQHCHLEWDDLTTIGSLPRLEVLKLDWDSVKGLEWNPVEGGFLSLRYLRISKCNGLSHWNADSSHFPVLENLVIEEMSELDEIPSGLGDIPTLRDIYLVDCSVSAVLSAVNILKEQESVGNQDLRVRVKFSWYKNKREEVREKLELEGFQSHNFQLS